MEKIKANSEDRRFNGTVKGFKEFSAGFAAATENAMEVVPGEERKIGKGGWKER